MSASAENWAGYAQAGRKGTFTAVTATFTVPTVDNGVSGVEYSSDWVGIGGFDDETLVQAGVEADNIAGNAYYDAWTEVLPADEKPIYSLAIRPGDTIVASVIEISLDTWKMSVSDVSVGRTVVRFAHYRSSGESAEAIMERPCVGAGCSSVSDLATLAPTSPETFDPVLTATSSPSTSPDYEPLLSLFRGSTLEDIVMYNNAGSTVIATPSNASPDDDAFTVADGSSIPAAPSN